MKNLYSILLSGLMATSLLFSISSCSEEDTGNTNATDRNVTFLSVNDMNANLDNFPRFAFIVDSLRQIYPNLILLSSGDNLTGHPASDQYDPKGMPVVELMNAVNFELTAIGDRDFDARQENLAKLTEKAQFDFLCSNMEPTDKFKTSQTKTIQTENGLKIGIASFLSVDENGLPYCHPNFVKGLTFHNQYQEAKKYVEMKDECDLVVFVNQLGFEGDKQMAEQFPRRKLDIIFSSAYGDDQPHHETCNGVLIAQAGQKLSSAVLVNVIVKENGVIETTTKLIPVGKNGNKDAKIENMVQEYMNNPSLNQTIATLEESLNFDQLGYLMADAIYEAKPVDVGIVNAGNIRTSSWDFKEVTPFDVYVLDPYENHVTTANMTGQELYDLFTAGYNDRGGHWVYPSSHMKVEYDVKGEELLEVRLFTSDGQPIDLKKTYKVAMNNYMVPAFNLELKEQPKHYDLQTTENMIEYLKQIKVVKSYANDTRFKVNKK